MWHKPVCVACKIDMRPEKNGVPFVEGYMSGEEMKPYKIWESDMWVCPGCGISVLVGFGSKPTAQNYEETFGAALARVQEDPWVVIERKRPDDRQ